MIARTLVLGLMVLTLSVGAATIFADTASANIYCRWGGGEDPIFGRPWWPGDLECWCTYKGEFGCLG
jgi:hypothetical protein